MNLDMSIIPSIPSIPSQAGGRVLKTVRDRDRAKAASELTIEVMRKGELRDCGRERKESRQMQASRDLYTAWRHPGPSVNLRMRI